MLTILLLRFYTSYMISVYLINRYVIVYTRVLTLYITHTHYTHTCIQTHYTHTCIQTHYTHTCIQTHCTHTCIQTYCTHTCIQTHCTHTCIQTHCTHTCIENRKLVYLRGLAILIVTKKRVRHAKCTSQLYKLYVVHVSQTYI